VIPHTPGAAEQHPEPDRKDRTIAIVAIAVAVLLIAGSVVALLLALRSREDAGGSGVVEPTAVAPSTSGLTSTVAPPVSGSPVVLRPTSITASGARKSVNLRCTGERVSYTAENLIDGDENTGWGVAGAGEGARVLLRFEQPTRITRISLTAGYTKLGPRAQVDCDITSAFDWNRHVTLVRYTFSDGTSVDQRLTRDPGLQPLAVDVTTSSVELAVLETYRPPGADDDTIMSELVLEGPG